MRCGDFVEVQYFTYARGMNDWPVDTCCYCCNTEELLTVDEMKNAYDTCSKQPLRLCTANYIDKAAQQKRAKEQKRTSAVAMGLKRAKR